MHRLLLDLRASEGMGLVALVLEPCGGYDLRAGVARACRPGVDSAPALAAKLRSWAGNVTAPTALPVPMLLRHWLPFGDAVIVPLATPAWIGGWLAVSATWCTPDRLASLRARAAEIALLLEEADRRRPTVVCGSISANLGARRLSALPRAV